MILEDKNIFIISTFFLITIYLSDGLSIKPNEAKTEDLKNENDIFRIKQSKNEKIIIADFEEGNKMGMVKRIKRTETSVTVERVMAREGARTITMESEPELQAGTTLFAARGGDKAGTLTFPTDEIMKHLTGIPTMRNTDSYETLHKLPVPGIAVDREIKRGRACSIAAPTSLILFGLTSLLLDL